MKTLRSIGRKTAQFLDEGVMPYLAARQLDAYSSSSPFVRKWLVRPAFDLRRLLFLGLKMRQMHLVYMKGTVQDGLPLSVACLMTPQSQREFKDLLFGDGDVTVEERNTCPTWQYPQRVMCAAEDVDLVLVEHSTLQTWTPPYGEWVAAAPRVRMVMEFLPGETWAQVERQLRRMAWNIKVVKRAGYTFEISHEQADFHYFYDRMYYPYVHLRHKDLCVIEREETLARDFEKGFVGFVRDTEGKRVAGILCGVCGAVCFGVVNGILDGDEQWLKKHALCAVYYFTIRWCFDQGLGRYDIGSCFPFSNDGIYTHKKRWGFKPSIELGMATSWLLWVPRHSQAALNCLRAHPFIPSITRYSGETLEQVFAVPSEAEG